MSATIHDNKSFFRTPTRQILTKEDLDQFQSSSACTNLHEFICKLSQSVTEKSLSFDTRKSLVVLSLLSILNALDSWIFDIPPTSQSNSRFGNVSFQIWFDRLAENVKDLTSEIVKPHDAVPEVATYLLHSFGDRKRIDYGTGHELNFICFLYCLERLGLVSQEDYPSLVLDVFWKYITLMKGLQYTYWLEPAGSHGVWGLDDYHFLPFLFGSSQLINHKYIKPKSIRDPEVLDAYYKQYMYLSCVKFVITKKSASLRWHSPMLDDISGVKTWAKVNEGMIKMYKAEVFGRLPIMQHFRFGSLITFQGSLSSANQNHHDDHEADHVHAFGQEFPDCCGIRIPSALAAAAAAAGPTTTPKRLPFD